MKEIIAMHGWGGSKNQWSSWIHSFQSSNWIWHSADRAYRNSSPYMPSWASRLYSNESIRVAICHSLGSHLIDNNVLSQATHVVLVNSFSRFIPDGRESRPTLVALNGMIQAIGTNQENAMLSNFHIKAYKPNKFIRTEPELTDLNLSKPGRLRLKKDLDLLLQSHSLPIGLTTTAEVLVTNSEKDYILSKVSKNKLIQDLTNHLKKPPTIMEIQEEGHTPSKTTIIERVKYWLESNYASKLAKASK